MSNVRGIILDVDGTLVASNDAHAHAWMEALTEAGKHVSYEEVRRRIGMGGDKLLPQVSGIQPDSAAGKRISDCRREIFKERYVPHLRPTPGAPELLQHLHAHGLPMVVASSAKRNELHTLLQVCGAADLIEDKTSSDDADRSKPDPDIIQVALQQIGLPPEQVVMLGDTPYDIESAGHAGVGVIAFRCGGWGDPDLAGALAIYDDPADLLAHHASSPLGKAGD